MTPTRVLSWLAGQMLILLLVVGFTASERSAAQETAQAAATPFPDYLPTTLPSPYPSNLPLFKLSQDYPTASPTPEPDQPWKQIDFQQQPEAYADAVLTYAFEGNRTGGDNPEFDFIVQENTVRQWYHAPWLHAGCGGREFVHGLTRERRSQENELYPGLETEFENWAVGFYNAPGGYTIGQVWKTPSGDPDQSLANFPEGTVSFKLLFTTATPEQVPFLEGGYAWTAYIYSPQDSNICGRDYQGQRVPQTVRLLQIDIAVKDSRATETGWVFGTFIYSGGEAGTDPLKKLVPVGLMWGNDPDVPPASPTPSSGAFINPNLKESWINPAVIANPQTPDPQANLAKMQHLGFDGRLNGPVDNPISSCMSCHATSSRPMSGMVPSAPVSPTEFAQFFANSSPGPIPAPNGGTHLDYSLQLAAGISKFDKSQPAPSQPGASQPAGAEPVAAGTSLDIVTREGVAFEEVAVEDGWSLTTPVILGAAVLVLLLAGLGLVVRRRAAPQRG